VILGNFWLINNRLQRGFRAFDFFNKHTRLFSVKIFWLVVHAESLPGFTKKHWAYQQFGANYFRDKYLRGINKFLKQR
jgi:hypothetical protein